ncbi:MAG: hypothetical protein WCO60_12395 [Verrucomicrobiota bacterium]
MKFMESFLANRPKVAAPEPQGDGIDVEGGAYGDLLDGDDGFGGGLSRSGGFQSLRSALLEAGNVVVPGAEPPVNQMGHGNSDSQQEPLVHQEPTVELVSNNGRIEKVIVTCSCCRRIELDCTY